MKQINTALKEYGNIAIKGATHNPRILEYFKEIGAGYIDDDETPWCAAFANWVLMKCNLPYTKKLNARSFLEIGIPTSNPQLGDLVILWRIAKNGPYGHVGFFVSQIGHTIYVLGGNQDDSVKIKGFSDDQLLGFRQLIIS
jgi:uncharacterized protein (TIGR02594 family)